MPHDADIIIIGAGVVGLAVAAEVASEDRDVYVLEKNETFGLETSSRHSGVIHSGMYYPKGSLKARLCVAGNRMLYRLCEKYGIGYKRLGKLVVATSEEETEELKVLIEKGRINGTEGLRILSEGELRELEPNVKGTAAILSPTTGIIDSHALMQYYITKAMDGRAQIAYKTKAVGIDKVADGYNVTVEDETGISSLTTGILINCAGLYCDKVAELAGINIEEAGYILHYCKGEYFSLSSSKGKLVKRLIYPVPTPHFTSLGIHLAPDLEGRVRLGPGAEYVDSIDYAMDDRNQKFFLNAVKRYLPFIEYDDLAPEMAGIRPKLQEPRGEVRDFVIRYEGDKGLPGLINLIGIESPGLTASPAIAEYVGGLVNELLA